MKKLFNWIWSNKQTETVEVFEVEPYSMLSVKVRKFNADHGFPLDQLICDNLKTPEERLKQKYH